MRVIAVVQARMGSRRLPGKSLMPVWRDMPLAELVLRRVAATRGLHTVVLATSASGADRRLLELADRVGVHGFAGPEDDVLDRFAQAVEWHDADAVVRVCADNPFVDPEAICDLVAHFGGAQPCDYASNLGPESGLPDGAGAEIVAVDALMTAAREGRGAAEREHVTPFIHRRPERFRLSTVPPPSPPWPRLKLDVDDEAELEAMRALASRLPEQSAPLWPLAEVVAAAERLRA
jgi:spore coat polysaccharide biosynthesis protein SpsF